MPTTSHRFRHDGSMGTTVEIRIETDAGGHDGAEEAEAIDATIIAELVRLERVFSAFDPDSELSRWRAADVSASEGTGTGAGVGAELSELLASALGWQHRTGGLFNPAVGELTQRWREGEETGRVPTADDLAAAAAAIVRPRYAMVDGRATPVGDCSRINLNALAKGHIVDRAVERAMERHRPRSVLVSAGGDLRVAGTVAQRIGVENPRRPYDNVPPLTVIELADAAVAGSGQARRGFTIGGRRFGHLIDPRTGSPVDGPAGVTVAASDAATADVVATAATVAAAAGAAAAIELVSGLDGVAILVVERDGRVVTDPTWIERFGPVGPVGPTDPAVRRG